MTGSTLNVAMSPRERYFAKTNLSGYRSLAAWNPSSSWTIPIWAETPNSSSMGIMLEMSSMVPMCVCASKIGPVYFHVLVNMHV